MERLDKLLAVQSNDGKNMSTWLGDIQTPNTDRTLATTRTTVNNSGTFVGMQIVVVSGSPARNLYVQALLEDYNRNLKGIIFRGYVEASKQPFGTGGLVVNQGDVVRLDSWGVVTCTIRLSGTLMRDKQTPGGWTGTNEGSLDGQGNIRVISGTNPAVAASDGEAAAEISETVPTGARWKPRAVSINLSASATAGNRNVTLSFSDGTNRFYSSVDYGSQTATQGIDYHWGLQGETRTGTGNTGTRDMVIPDIILKAAGKIYTQTQNLKMGDNYAAPVYEVEEWIDP